MINQREPKQLELPAIDTGFYTFATKDVIDLTVLDPKAAEPEVENTLEEYQASFAF